MLGGVKLLACLLLLTPLAFARASAQEVTVFAASSLTEAFEEVASAFERQTGAEVRLNFGGSATLSTQIVQGAPADVFASADAAQMGRVEGAGLVQGEPHTFASNRLVVIASEDGQVECLEDLAEPGTLLVLASPEVPVGGYAREALLKLNRRYGPDFSARVLSNLVSEEPNVRQAAAKVALGEADAALVYATDAAVLEGVRAIPLPDEFNVTARYPVAALAGGGALAEAFVRFVLSGAGQRILAAHGFLP